MAKKTKSVGEIQRTPLYFRSRMEADDVEIDGITFRVQGLPTSVLAFAYDRMGEQGQMELLLTVVKFGLVGVEGMLDQDGKPVMLETTEVKIGHVQRQAVTKKFIDGLPFPVLGILGPRIIELSGLGEAEKTKLDFTTPSQESEG